MERYQMWMPVFQNMDHSWMCACVCVCEHAHMQGVRCTSLWVCMCECSLVEESPYLENARIFSWNLWKPPHKTILFSTNLKTILYIKAHLVCGSGFGFCSAPLVCFSVFATILHSPNLCGFACLRVITLQQWSST